MSWKAEGFITLARNNPATSYVPVQQLCTGVGGVSRI